MPKTDTRCTKFRREGARIRLTADMTGYNGHGPKLAHGSGVAQNDAVQ